MTVRFSVKVQPNAGRSEIVGQVNGVWKLKIAAPPDKGKANKELVNFLSARLEIKKAQVTLIRGETSHNKVIEIEGLNEVEVVKRLGGSIQ